MALRLFYIAFLVTAVSHLGAADEDEKDLEQARKPMEDSLDGFGDWFKGMAEGAKDRASDGIETLKDYSEGVRKMSADAAQSWSEKAEDGLETLKGMADGARKMSSAGQEMTKGWAAGLGQSFEKAKEKVSQAGEKMKEAMGDAALNTKEELESAASKMSQHAKDAGETVWKLFG